MKLRYMSFGLVVAFNAVPVLADVASVQYVQSIVKQADWNQTNSEARDYIKNKPTIPAAQVQSDWNASSGMGVILNKPTLATVATSGSYNDLSNKPTLGDLAAKDTVASTDLASGVQASLGLADTAVQPGDLATVATSGSYNDLTNKPTIPAAQVNSDWNATSGVAQILNKPTLGDLAAKDTVALTDLASTVQTSLGKADTAVQPGSLAAVATSGSYNDLSNKPTIPAAQVQSDWNASTGMGVILNKPTLATVATSGSYNDLTNKPTIPAAQVQSDWNASSGMGVILNKPTLATVATSGSYNDLSNKPTIPSSAGDVGAVAATQTTKGGILTTNASTGAVEVSTAIAESQVTNLTTDLAGKQGSLGGTGNDGKAVIASSTAGTVTYKSIDATTGGTSSSTDLITSGAVNAGLAGKAASNDPRFDTVSTSALTGTAPTGRVFVWFE